jgi:Ca2+-binding EF-hand superfamily protein
MFRQQRREKDVLNRKSIGMIGVAVGLLLAGGCCALAQSSDGAARPAADKTGPDAWDVNHDGVYTCDEWKSYLERMFTLADRNHDGHLDAKEFEAVRKAVPMLADADFGYFDENQDGKVTRKEFVAKPSEFILKYDRNGDCRVTPEEIRAGNTPPAPQGPQERPRDRFHYN